MCYCRCYCLHQEPREARQRARLWSRCRSRWIVSRFVAQYIRKSTPADFNQSVAEFLPGFEGRVRQALKVLLGEECEGRIRIGLAKDGSGVGAALTALQAKKALDKRMGTKTAASRAGGSESTSK